MVVYWVICNTCDHSFDIAKGSLGESGDYPTYCNQCGKQCMMKAWDWRDQNLFSCECGGTYDENHEPKCPQCQSDSYRNDDSKGITLCD